MFERFTDDARNAVKLAQEESRQLGHKHIGTVHLLLGLLRATGDDNLALEVLADAKVDTEALRATATQFIQANAA